MLEYFARLRQKVSIAEIQAEQFGAELKIAEETCTHEIWEIVRGDFSTKGDGLLWRRECIRCGKVETTTATEVAQVVVPKLLFPSGISPI